MAAVSMGGQLFVGGWQAWALGLCTYETEQSPLPSFFTEAYQSTNSSV